MPKGRSFAPQTEVDGVWFQHRGLPDPGPLLRECSTSTGLMLNSPYKAHTASYPPQPPQPYKHKDTGRDTRGLGKNILPENDRQHCTEKDYLKHNGRIAVNYDYKTEYYNKYTGEPTEKPPTRRRFPKIHKDGDPDLLKLDTTTVDWFQHPDVPHKTPTQVLAVSQEPFLPSNSWKYSYHGRSQCYPSYNINPKKYRSWYLPGISDSNVPKHPTDLAV